MHQSSVILKNEVVINTNVKVVIYELSLKWIAYTSGFHVKSKKNKAKHFKFLPLSGKSHFSTYICWPVFSSVDRFVLKIK